MARDPILDLFGEDPEMQQEIARVRALRGDPAKAQRLMRLGTVGAMSSDEGLRGIGDNLYRTGAVQEDRYNQAAEEAYTGLKQTRAQRAKDAEAQRRWEAEMALRRQQAAASQAAQLAQLGMSRERLALSQQAAERARLAGQSAAEARQLASDMKARAERTGVQRSLDSAERNLQTVQSALAHPGRKAATGLSGEIARRLPYSDARGFQSVENQLLGSSFLAAFESLKGGGQITEIEGKKATDAITRLNTPGLPEDEYEAALRELEGVMQLGVTRAKQQGYDIGLFKDLPGLPSGAPDAQATQPNAFGMPRQGGRGQSYLDRVMGGG